MFNPSRRPRSLSEILNEIFTVRGYGRWFARQELENAWDAAVGEPHCHQTRVGEVRHGVLNVTVAHSTLLEELVAFRKGALLASLQSGSPGIAMRDIRFRLGSIALEIEPALEPALSLPVADVPLRFGLPAPRQYAQVGIRSKSRRNNGHAP